MLVGMGSAQAQAPSPWLEPDIDVAPFESLTHLTEDQSVEELRNRGIFVLILPGGKLPHKSEMVLRATNKFSNVTAELQKEIDAAVAYFADPKANTGLSTGEADGQHLAPYMFYEPWLFETPFKEPPLFSQARILLSRYADRGTIIHEYVHYFRTPHIYPEPVQLSNGQKMHYASWLAYKHSNLRARRLPKTPPGQGLEMYICQLRDSLGQRLVNEALTNQWVYEHADQIGLSQSEAIEALTKYASQLMMVHAGIDQLRDQSEFKEYKANKARLATADQRKLEIYETELDTYEENVRARYAELLSYLETEKLSDIIKKLKEAGRI